MFSLSLTRFAWLWMLLVGTDEKHVSLSSKSPKCAMPNLYCSRNFTNTRAQYACCAHTSVSCCVYGVYVIGAALWSSARRRATTTDNRQPDNECSARETLSKFAPAANDVDDVDAGNGRTTTPPAFKSITHRTRRAALLGAISVCCAGGTAGE